MSPLPNITSIPIINYQYIIDPNTPSNAFSIVSTLSIYEGENETYIEASAENSGSTLYDKEIRDKPRTRHTKRNV